jgi:hypothetical protein
VSKARLFSRNWLCRAYCAFLLNRNGVWHLKEENPSPARVWRIEQNSKPAKEAPSEGRNGKAKLDSQRCEELRGIFE